MRLDGRSKPLATNFNGLAMTVSNPVIAFLPCRKGSERVARKNIRPFGPFVNGLIEIKLCQLLACPAIERVVLSTNDEERRDLDFLSDAGLLQRTRGGAVSHVPASKTFEPAASVSGVLASAEKRAIGQHAAQQIKSGQTVLFDSGTTTIEAARAAVALRLKFTAITNDLLIAGLLSMEPGIDVIVPGGMLRSGTPTILGSTTQDFMSRLSVDLLMLGAHGVHDGRLSDTSIELADLKRCMITISETRLLLVDSGKFERCAFAIFGNVSDFNQVITDDALAWRPKRQDRQPILILMRSLWIGPP